MPSIVSSTTPMPSENRSIFRAGPARPGQLNRRREGRWPRRLSPQTPSRNRDAKRCKPRLPTPCRLPERPCFEPHRTGCRLFDRRLEVLCCAMQCGLPRTTGGDHQAATANLASCGRCANRLRILRANLDAQCCRMIAQLLVERRQLTVLLLGTNRQAVLLPEVNETPVRTAATARAARRSPRAAPLLGGGLSVVLVGARRFAQLKKRLRP